VVRMIAKRASTVKKRSVFDQFIVILAYWQFTYIATFSKYPRGAVIGRFY